MNEKGLNLGDEEWKELENNPELIHLYNAHYIVDELKAYRELLKALNSAMAKSSEGRL